MITLHLVRHGETIWHEGNRYAGSTDVPLTERGLDQARTLLPWGRDAGLSAVVTSDLSRAVVTGEQLAAGAGLAPRIDPRVREVDFGRGEGLLRAEMQALFPAELAAFTEHPATHPLPDAESGEAASRRALAAVVDLAQAVEDRSAVAIVAHTTIIRLLLCSFLGLPLDDYRRRFPALDNATITTVLIPRAATSEQLLEAGALLRYNCPPS